MRLWHGKVVEIPESKVSKALFSFTCFCQALLRKGLAKAVRVVAKSRPEGLPLFDIYDLGKITVGMFIFRGLHGWCKPSY